MTLYDLAASLYTLLTEAAGDPGPPDTASSDKAIYLALIYVVGGGRKKPDHPPGSPFMNRVMLMKVSNTQGSWRTPSWVQSF